MVVSRIDEVVQLTADKISADPNIVADVVRHTLTYLKDFFNEPTAAGVRIPYLGTFTGRYSVINHYIRTVLIPAIREATTEERKTLLLDQLRKVWKFRRIIQENDRRRQYKKRFGNWHYKRAEPSDLTGG